MAGSLLSCRDLSHDAEAGKIRFSDLLARGDEILRRAGVETARLDSELILAHVLNADRARVISRLPDHVPGEVVARFFSLVKRRAAREPLAYITGVKEFYSLEFRTTPDVLIPRPETETVVDAVVELYDPGSRISALDVGTGSGAIAIALAHCFPGWRITAVDKSERALSIAEENAGANEVDDRIAFKTSDVFSALPEERFDLIVANPPYVREEDKENLAPELEYEPCEALYAGPDGLDVAQKILEEARERLSGGGMVVMEIGDGQASRVHRIAEEKGFYKNIRFKRDLHGIERVLLAERKSRG